MKTPLRALALAATLAAFSAAQAEQVSLLSISTLFNNSMASYTAAGSYPGPGTLAVGGINFTLQDYGNGYTGVVGGLAYAQQTYTLSNLNIAGATKAYVLLDGAWGTCGETVGSISIASTGTAGVDLVEGVNVRDHYNGSYCNTVTDVYATWSSVNGARWDVVEIDLSAATVGGTAAVTGFSFTNNGLAGNGGSPFIAAVTFVTSEVPEPATAALALLALGGVGALRRRR